MFGTEFSPNVLTVTLIETDYLMPSSNPYRITEFFFPGETVDKYAAEIWQAIQRNSLKDGYAIRETKSIAEQGASGSGQDILITIATAVMSGAAGATVKELFSILKPKTKEATQEITLSKELMDVEPEIRRIETFMRRHFSNYEDLTFTKIESGEGFIRANVTDSKGQKYLAEIGNDRTLSVTKLP